MNNIHRLIAACAVLIAALTLLVPLGEIESDDCYDDDLSDNLPVLSANEDQNVIDWKTCPIKLSYSFNGTDWTEIPFFYDEYSLISYSIHEDALDLSGMGKNDIIYMKAEPIGGFSAVSNESAFLIENFEVSWWHTSSEDVTLNYTAFVKLQNDGWWSWDVPISTLGECGRYDYLSIGFSINGTKCQCNLYNDLGDQRIVFLSLNSKQSIQSELDALVGTYICDKQTIQIYKDGGIYVKRILGEVTGGHPATGKIGDMYYILGETGIKETLVTVGYTVNAYLSIGKDSDGVISLTAVGDYTYSSTDPESGIISKGSVFKRESTGISINGLEYPDLQTAINYASDGDIINLDVGTYNLDKYITIDKNIILKGIIGETKEVSSVITGFQGSSTDQVNIRITKTVTLDSLWIDGGSDYIKFNGDNAGGIVGLIDLQNSNNSVIQNCNFTKANEPSGAVAIYAGQGSLICNNYFEGWHKAVYSEVKPSSNSKISIINNEFSNPDPSISGNPDRFFINVVPSNVTITGNIFNNGIVANSSDVVIIDNNIFYNSILEIYNQSIEVLENVFASDVVIKNGIETIIDLSANYWGGNEPKLDDKQFSVNSWYTQYDCKTKTLSGLTFKGDMRDIYVDCNNESGDGTKGNPYKTISEALSNVKYGQVIHVAAGTYNEEILITSEIRNVTILGSNSENDANGKTWNQNGTILTKGISITTHGTHENPNPTIVDGLTIKGFDFKNKGFVIVGWWKNGSISNIVIDNNRFIDIDDLSNSAIHFNTSEPMAVNNITIHNNLIKNVGTENTKSPSGINISSASGTVIIDNNFIINTNHGSIQVANLKTGSLEITNNHLENWDYDQANGGRAFRLSYIFIEYIIICNNSLVQINGFNGEDLNDMYLKISDSETYIVASENFWDGKNPTSEDFPIKLDEKCMIGINSWYTQYDPESNTLSGLEPDIPGVVPDVPDTPTFPDVPDVPVTPEVPVPDENGNIDIEIPKSDIDKIVDDAVSSGSESVTITDVSDIEDVSSVTIGKENLQEILDKIVADDSISEAVVKLPEGSVSIGKDVLSSILETTEESSITIKVSDAKDELNEKQKEAIGDRPVYDITMLKGNEKITSFNGKTITVSLPYELKENELPDNIVVYYVKDDGNTEKMNCVYKDGNVSFETSHLSYFAISYELPEPMPEEPAGSSNAVYYAIAVVAILIVIAAAAYFIVKRKQ